MVGNMILTLSISKIHRKVPFFIIIISIHTLIISCAKEDYTPAIVLTFDDNHVESWYENRAIFNKYNAKVTFFITKPHKLSKKQIDLLLQL